MKTKPMPASEARARVALFEAIRVLAAADACNRMNPCEGNAEAVKAAAANLTETALRVSLFIDLN